MSEMPEKVALYSYGGAVSIQLFDLCPPIGATQYTEYTRSDIHAKLRKELEGERLSYALICDDLEIMEGRESEWKGENAKLTAKLEEAKGILQIIFGWDASMTEDDWDVDVLPAIRQFLEKQ